MGAACVLVLGFYAWTARPSVRQMYDINDPAEAYYNQLIHGFRSGQLNLKKEIPPGLAKLADPYDPVANARYRKKSPLHDTSYYKNKLYLYFGVTPAMVLFWPYAALTGHYLFHKQAVAVFCSIGFLASVALLCALRRRYFPEVGMAVVAACALALGLATCAPVMLQRPDLWEVPISCAYAMVMLALAGVWRALHDPTRRCWWLAAASLAYGLAVGARPTVLFGAVILLAPVVHAWLAATERNGRRRWVVARTLAAAVGPISFIGFGLMLYNYLRFDNPFEFGQHYQLSANKETEMQHLFGLNCFWFNFRVYFLQPIHWNSAFPFVTGIKVPPAPAGQLGVENPFGVLSNIPLVWMALAVPLAWQKRTVEDRSALRLFTAALAVLFGISALTICLFYGACVRYELDFMPWLALLAVGGILGLERALAATPRWRNVARGVWVAALFFSVAVNLLVNVQLYTTRKRLDAGLDQLQLGRPKEAALCFEQVLRINPDSAMAHYNLGRTLLLFPGHLPDAITEFETAVRLQPDYPEAHCNLGVLLRQTGNLSAAIAEYKAALQNKPDYAEAYNNLDCALLQIPGRLPDAMAAYQTAVRIDPDYADAHYNLGYAFSQTPGHLPDEISHFEAALKIKPGLTAAHYQLGTALLQQGLYSAACEQYEETLKLKPGFVEGHVSLGVALARMGRLDEALTQFETALQIKPDDPSAQKYLEMTQAMLLKSRGENLPGPPAP